MAKKRKSTSKKTTRKSYEHPVPDRNAILEFLREAAAPRSEQELQGAFQLKSQKGQEQLSERLQGMIRAGLVLRNRQGEYLLAEKLDLVPGAVIGHPDGYAFLRPDAGGDDIYLSARDARTVIDGDRVVVRITGDDRRGRPAGRVVEILERGTEEVAGQFIRERGIGLVIPDNPRIGHRILVPKDEAGAAKPGQYVVVRILDYPTDQQQATGTVVHVIGDPHQKGIATDIAIHAHGIPDGWPAEVGAEARRFGRRVPPEALRGREDLRDLGLVTIDGEDARDFDDAVHCYPTSNGGWRLLVAIADVAHYVEIGSPIDKEALRRGTSVYFPDRVVPMLPEILSNGLCSLNPKVDRLCLVCDMRISSEGKVTRSHFFEAVMRSTERLTYNQVNAFLTGQRDHGIPSRVHDVLHDLHGLYKALARNRDKRGALELDIPQTKIRLGDEGEVVSIAQVERNDAHRLIEECMIAANVQAAKFLRRHRIPGLYRVHAKPDPERFEELRQYLVSLGLKVAHPQHVQPRDFRKIVDQVRDRPDSAAISMSMLRSLPHAEYTPANIGHFGLALDTYAHFTSPIRRYPDLLVHRAIRHILRGETPARYEYSADRMERLGSVCSAHERRAEEATREVEALLKCQFMEDKVGREFDGAITGVTGFGVFVQLDECGIDGLVHVSALGHDYYTFDSATMSMRGENTGGTFRMGDRLRVVVQRVDLETRRIDFSLADRAGVRRDRFRRPERGRRR
ncbi:MAG: ribonuclease R [Gammaproteobacteria bacterium]|nr:ribonuclease R [Gammaproteobacteria bacterium]MDH4254457.1 ribonuclease R [Gammaproteobacteria bacterium]MDH5309412.1 ribonuclease R [Gammaproteobacteria bacterium]